MPPRPNNRVLQDTRRRWRSRPLRQSIAPRCLAEGGSCLGVKLRKPAQQSTGRRRKARAIGSCEQTRQFLFSHRPWSSRAPCLTLSLMSPQRRGGPEPWHLERGLWSALKIRSGPWKIRQRFTQALPKRYHRLTPIASRRGSSRGPEGRGCVCCHISCGRSPPPRSLTVFGTRYCAKGRSLLQAVPG